MSYKVIGIGEALWDLFPDGPRLGGAPANFAYHAHALGAQARVITRVGKDDYGRAIQQRFEQLGIADGTVQTDEKAPTGTVTVTLAGRGIPQFCIHQNVAWDQIAITPPALAAMRSADALCFGSLAQRSEPSRTSIQRLVAAAPASALRVFDINLRQDYFSREVIEQSLRLANVLKLNDGELPVIAEMFNLAGTVRQQLEDLAAKFGLQLVALTRGAEGSLLYQGGRWSDCRSVPVEVVDTVGAGDAFTAALVLGLLKRMDLEMINALAGEVARHVCSCSGATPPLPRSLCDRFVARKTAPDAAPEKFTAARGR